MKQDIFENITTRSGLSQPDNPFLKEINEEPSLSNKDFSLFKYFEQNRGFMKEEIYSHPEDQNYILYCLFGPKSVSNFDFNVPFSKEGSLEIFHESQKQRCDMAFWILGAFPDESSAKHWRVNMLYEKNPASMNWDIRCKKIDFPVNILPNDKMTKAVYHQKYYQALTDRNKQSYAGAVKLKKSAQRTKEIIAQCNELISEMEKSKNQFDLVESNEEKKQIERKILNDIRFNKYIIENENFKLSNLVKDFKKDFKITIPELVHYADYLRLKCPDCQISIFSDPKTKKFYLCKK